MSTVTQLLAQAIGLDVVSVGQSTLERAVEKRIKATRANSIADYLNQITGQGKELENLIEEVVVPETWFMREAGAFDGLHDFVFGQWLPRHPTGVLRLASIPCSTGEEPYSLAMKLLDWGLREERFHIDALDISWVALGRANKGEYGTNSFRTSETGFRDRYFEPIDAGRYRLGEHVRRQVTFHQGNVLTLPSAITGRVYDAIFCRNLLIYLGDDSRNQLLAQFKQLLCDGGLLCVGHAETGILLQAGLSKSGNAAASSTFTFSEATNQQSARPTALSRPERRRRQAGVPLPRPQPPGSTPPASSDAAAAPAADKQAEARDTALHEAQMAADAGRLDEAQRLCEQVLRDAPFSAEAYYLLGVIATATGDLRLAVQHYRKVVYIDPGHAEALLHLAQAGERAGDGRQAAALRARASRSVKEDSHE